MFSIGGGDAPLTATLHVYSPLTTEQANEVKAKIRDSIEFLTEYFWRSGDVATAVRAAALHQHIYPGVYPFIAETECQKGRYPTFATQRILRSPLPVVQRRILTRPSPALETRSDTR